MFVLASHFNTTQGEALRVCLQLVQRKDCLMKGVNRFR
jgi:hypothetical protein